MIYADKKQIIFYQKIGELFYAIAASDKVVRKQEFKALRKLVRTEWSSIDDYEDEFHTDAVYQMEIVFEWFQYEQMDGEECFQSFSTFYNENKKLFNTERKRLIWKTVNAIANAFAGKNKSELIMLTNLLLLLKEDE
jgi:hypothetical protein